MKRFATSLDMVGADGDDEDEKKLRPLFDEEVLKEDGVDAVEAMFWLG